MKNHKFEILHSATLTGTLLLAMALSGCISRDALMADEAYQPYNGSDQYPITVAKGPVMLEVSTNNGTLQADQINAVQGFLHQATSAGITPITLARPSGGGNSTRVAGEIASLMAGQGIQRQQVVFATYDAPANAPIKLSYISTYAKTKACGDWDRDITDTSQNTVGPNHGCAVQANIAAMIADPETLVVPEAETPILASSRIKAVTATATGSTTSSSSPSSSPSAPATTP